MAAPGAPEQVTNVLVRIDRSQSISLGFTPFKFSLHDCKDGNVPFDFTELINCVKFAENIGGLPVQAVDAQGNAARAGLRVWDVIIGVNGSDVRSIGGQDVINLLLKLKQTPPNQAIELTVCRTSNPPPAPNVLPNPLHPQGQMFHCTLSYRVSTDQDLVVKLHHKLHALFAAKDRSSHAGSGGAAWASPQPPPKIFPFQGETVFPQKFDRCAEAETSDFHVYLDKFCLRNGEEWQGTGKPDGGGFIGAILQSLVFVPVLSVKQKNSYGFCQDLSSAPDKSNADKLEGSLGRLVRLNTAHDDRQQGVDNVLLELIIAKALHTISWRARTGKSEFYPCFRIFPLFAGNDKLFYCPEALSDKPHIATNSRAIDLLQKAGLADACFDKLKDESVQSIVNWYFSIQGLKLWEFGIEDNYVEKAAAEIIQSAKEELQHLSEVIEDVRFEAAYAEALKSSGRPFSFAQLCLVGEGRAGKTALANSLCGREFRQTDSTIGVELEKMQVTHADLHVAGTGRWSALQESAGRADKFAEDQLAWAIAQNIEGKQGSSGDGSIADILHVCKAHKSFDFTHDSLATSSFSDLGVDASLVSSPSSSSAAASAAASQLQLDLSNASDQGQPADPAQAPSPAFVTDASAPATRMDKAMVLRRSGEKEPFRINMTDLGGQKSFYSLHSLYLTRNSVYLVVFNMQWLVGSTADMAAGRDGITKRDSCFNYLTFWLHSIFLHTKAADQSVAPILLVGTHGDMVRSPAEHEAVSSMIHERFKASPVFDSVVPLQHGTTSSGRGLLWFYPVDNTRSGADEGVDSIKTAVHDCLKKEEYLKRKVPLPWLQTLDAIQATKQSHISLDLATSIALRNGLPVTQLSLEDEVLRMLKYFSDLGLLMHHNRPTLRHLVVLDTLRCLVTPASIVMCQHDIHMLDVHKQARRSKSEAYRRLTTEGVLDKCLLDILWVDCKDISKEVAELMVLYGLMLPLLEQTRGAFSQYIVPSLLPDHAVAEAQAGVLAHCYFLFGTADQTSSWEKSGNVASSVVSSHGFCPAGLFSRLTGKIVSECQITYNYFGSRYGGSRTSACFGRHVFVVQELLGMNMIQLLVMVHNPRKLVSEISRLVQSVIDEMIPSLGFIVAVFDDGGSGQNFQRADVKTAHFVSLSRAIKCISSGDIVHVNSGTNTRLSCADARVLLQRWIPPAGLLDCYDVFLSYRWTGSFDEDLTLGLFNNLSEDVFGSSGREIGVFLDKRRLQDGRNFQDDFADALLKTSLPVVILSTAALQRMVKLQADSAIDNLLLEWTLIVELLHSKTITYCLPIIIGTYNPSAPSCASVIEDFFKVVVKAADGSVFYSGIDSLPDVSVASIILKVRRMLQQHQLPESSCLSSHTVRSVVKHLSLHQAVFASKLFDDHKFQDVPASHAKEEVTRTVVEHCGGRIRGMLDSIEAGKSPLSPVAAQRSVADHPPSLASITASQVAEAIGRIGAAYLVYQQAFVDNGIDGTMLADWLGQSDEDILRVLTTDLGMSSSLHSKRVLLELKKLWAPPPA